MTVKVTIEGLAEVKTALRALPDVTAKNVVRRVLRSRGEPIAARARRLVPVEEGELQGSIAVSTRLSRRQRARRRKFDPNDIEVYIGAGPLPQAHLQEFGTEHALAQPFLRPAWDGGKREVLEGIKADLWAEILQAVGRLARKAVKARQK
jgi:HK97 gp10 family phage protein